MAFWVSRPQSALPETEKGSLDQPEDKNSATLGAISSQLYLKSSLSSTASPQTLDKQVVLRRIRHRKSLNKVKSVFECLLDTSGGYTATAHEQKWLQQDDAFSAP